MTTLSEFARTALFSPEAAPVAFDVLVSLGFTGDVCANPNLPFDTARALLARKPKISADAATSLALHSWDPEQAFELLKLDNRKSVVMNLIHCSVLPLEALELILGRKDLDEKMAEAVLYSQYLDDVYRARFARHGGAIRRLSALLDDATRTGDLAALRTALLELDVRHRARVAGLSQALQEVVFHHPELLGLLDEDVVLPNRVRSAFAASVHLIEERHQRNLAGLDPKRSNETDELWTLMVLGGNPLTRQSVLRDLLDAVVQQPFSDPKGYDLQRNIERRITAEQWLSDGATAVDAPTEKLPWLLRRALPSQFHSGRVFEMLRLCENNNLTHDDAARLHAALWQHDDNVLARAAVLQLAKRFPPLDAELPEIPSLRCDTDPPEAYASASRTRSARLAYASSLEAAEIHADTASEIEVDAQIYNISPRVGILASRRFGADRQRWEAMFTLLPGYTGTFGDLLDAAAML